MQRLFNLDKWQEVGDGLAVNFAKAEPRRVRLDVNAPDAVRVFHSDGNGVVTFLARVLGRDVLEFAVDGEFAITVDGGSLWLFTVDGEDVSFEPSSSPILTKIAERRPRNLEFEMMQYEANRNMEMRMERMRRELDAEWSRRITANPAAAVKPSAKGNGPVDKPEPEPAVKAAGGDDGVKALDAGSGSGDTKK